MTNLNRKDFIRKLAVIVAGASVLPAALVGYPAKATAVSGDEASTPPALRIDDLGIIDLHCHPSLKMYLWNKHFWKKYNPKSGTNPFPLQDTVDELSSGYVKGFLVAHYLVEAALESESAVLKNLFPFIRRLFPGLAAKVEHEDSSNFTQINIMIDTMESQVHQANKEQGRVRFVIARDFSEFEQAIKDGNIPIAHAIEGAHALGRNFPLTHKRRVPLDNEHVENIDEKTNRYIRNLEALKWRGVCLLTLGHIFVNDIAHPTEGISPDEKHAIKMDWQYLPMRDDLPLTGIGVAVVEKMLDIGMIVDLTHSTPAARQDVFRINANRKKVGKALRPLTFTHTGSQTLFEQYDARYNNGRYENFKYYDASDQEIDQICDCSGVIGVIPENFWLVACDTKLDKHYARLFRDGIPYIVETILCINSKTRSKDFDNISIGTDFDGFADAPRDLYKPSQLGALIQALRDAKITEKQIRKITNLNALRLLREGWGS